MTPKQILFIVLYTITLLVNGWKLYYMYNFTGEYKIYPWQRDGSLTNTPKPWILVHMISAFILLTSLVIYSFLINVISRWILLISHSLFSIIIFSNSAKLGQFPTNYALTINISAVFALTILLIFNFHIAYMFILLVPVIIECGFLLEAFRKHIQIYFCDCEMCEEED